MNCPSRVILPLGALVIFAGSLFADDGIELKERWTVGKKYYQTTQTIQTSTTIIAGQTREKSHSTTMEMSAAVRAQGDGKGKRMTVEINRVAMEMSINGQNINFDSGKPGEGNDPLGVGKTMGSLVGKKLQMLLNEKDEITEFENYDEFIKLLGSSMPGMDMSKVFSKESMTQMMNVRALHTLPGNPVKPGDRWPFSTKMDLPQLGKGGLTGTYTLKSVADRDGVQVAEIIVDSIIDFGGADSSNPATPQADQRGAKMKKGSIKGTIWFDPKLGFERDSQLTQEMTTKNPSDPSDTILNKQTTKTKLTKVEDLE
jgi:hypothetical protein